MLVIIGSGAVASEVTLFFGNIKGYIDYEENIDKYWKNYQFDSPVLGDIDSYEFAPDDEVVLGMADIPFRRKMIAKVKERGGKFVNLIHPSVLIDKNTIIGEGNVIHPNCIIETKVKIGSFNYLTSPSIIAHDSTIGDNNILSGSLLCGHVTVGNDNRFCIRSTVQPEITIGSNNTIQAGMIVTSEVKDNETVFHWYKEKIYSRHGAIL